MLPAHAGVQALNSINKPEYARLTWTGKIVTLDDLGIDVERADGTDVRYLNHHMERLTAVSGGVGSNVSVNNHWAILRCGSYNFSSSEDLRSAAGRLRHRPPLANPTDEERAALICGRPDVQAAVRPGTVVIRGG